jgi:hypothetical protein
MLVALRDRRGVGNLDVSFIEAKHRVRRNLFTSASFPYISRRERRKERKNLRELSFPHWIHVILLLILPG